MCVSVSALALLLLLPTVALVQHLSGRFGVQDLFQGRISVRSTVDDRVQIIVNEALENGLALYERRHLAAKGLIQGSVVVLRNADGAILAEAGGRQLDKGRYVRYSDYNRATGSLRQPGSAWKPVVYLAAFRQDMNLDTLVPDEPIAVPGGPRGGVNRSPSGRARRPPGRPGPRVAAAPVGCRTGRWATKPSANTFARCSLGVAARRSPARARCTSAAAPPRQARPRRADPTSESTARAVEGKGVAHMGLALV